MQSDKEFGLPGRDHLPKHSVINITTNQLPAVKGYKAHVKLIPGSESIFCKARKTPLPLKYKVTEKLEKMVRQGIFEPVQPSGVTDASPGVWQRKKSGELRLCVDLKVLINGKVMVEDCPIPDMETIFHILHGALYFGKIDLSDSYYQIELDEEAKYICTINKSQGLLKMCRLPQALKNSSSIFQTCIESTLKGIKSVVIFQDDLLVYGTTKEQFDMRMIAVKSQLCDKNVTINEKSLTQNQSIALTFWNTLFLKKYVEKKAKAPTNNTQIESFVGSQIFTAEWFLSLQQKCHP